MKCAKPTHGGSIVSMLIAIGIIGLLVAALSKSFSTNIKTIKWIETRGEEEDLRRFLRIRISCENTFKNKVGCNGKKIALRTSKGEIFVSESGTKYGAYTLTAQCLKVGTSTTKELRVFSTNHRNEKKNLFEKVPYLCAY